jgi:beta-lactamase class A
MPIQALSPIKSTFSGLTYLISDIRRLWHIERLSLPGDFPSKENSEEILKILSRSTYNDGIRKNIPDSVTIAHKMGVRAEYQLLSDCGIIYVPKRPYYLCVMINDKDVDHATTTLQKISTLIYTYISKQ